ncbi:GNAT family N-acetyltransferase [Nocardioides sp. Y6]|uniref:GNAT family N-acetyltransferase n=1 Tax=Nocardioides malaquae TaxID=2773426 RepID=A0ABR9RUR3_9ACTN|nr:GNAT family N-acetyltransferase [Nocardioides malaquae]MBE7325296.1 GNAT family N-acetyltransferase [Nocardioides malaquae]
MRDLLTTASDTIEADFAALQAAIAASPVLSSSDEPDATVYWSNQPLALLNVIVDAHIAPEVAAARAQEILAPFFERGLPFQWVTTPRTTSPALEAALAQAGLAAREYPAMFVALGQPIDPRTPEDVFIDVAWPDGVEPVSRVILEDLGHPAVPEEGSALGVLDTLDPADNQFFVARSMRTGDVLGASTMHTRGSSAMLANVSITAAARGRGVGRALTATMMNRAAATGCQSATLITNSRAYPTYVDLGFRTQFTCVAWAWDPRS